MTLKQWLLCLIGKHGTIIADLTYNTEYCVECGRKTSKFIKEGKNR